MADRTYLGWPFLEDRHRELKKQLDDWCQKQEFKHDEDIDDICRELVKDLGKGEILRYCVPASSGGATEHLDVRSLALCRETLSYHSGLADFSFAMQGLGSGAISLFGTEIQQGTYLPGIAAGKLIAAFALSEADAGSDVAALAMTADRDGDTYILNGEKTWISNGGIADFYCVFARTGEGPGARGLSAFVVDATASGLSIADRIDTIAPHPLAKLSFVDCRVSVDAMIGGPGEGFKVAMATLDVFRTTVAAAALGFARRALDEALQHTSTRKLFGEPLSALQMTESAIADMATEIDASALLIYRSAWAKDCHQSRVTREAAMAKLYATEAAQKIIDRAVQLFGGQGVTKGNIAESLYREIRALRIYEGASEVQKVIIARQTYGGRD
ncbi:MAG: acyl-CoA dehydrogenase [Woeseia sp.]|nr:acyl-CoA dehydrogenase [Woeseia sp.]|tara:strand:+ start:440 stop:1600 length:1161 start_codon:yes stop_codon:yes gene_type:complete